MRTITSPTLPLENDALTEGATLLSDASVRAYAAAWKRFRAWCAANEEADLPATAEAVAAFLTQSAEQGIKAATLTRWMAGISHYHRGAGYDSPTAAPHVRRTLRLLRRRFGSAQTQKAPLLIDDLREVLERLPETIIGRRDAALLLLGFAGAFRRSELVALEVSDIGEAPQGIIVTLRRSKTDQEGKGYTLAIPFGRQELTCPVRAVRRWREISGVASGPLLRSVDRHGNVGKRAMHPESVAAVVKRAAASIGLDPDAFGGHSLRAGLTTSAYLGGAEDRTIMRQSRHKSRKMLDVYIRAAEMWKSNAATKAGL